MNYFNLYNSLICKARNRELYGYKEKHHIVPRCMGGTDDESNLVELTAREHYIAHRLLTKIYPNESGLIFALHRMANCGIQGSRWYERDRILHAKTVSIVMKNLWNINREKWSPIISHTNKTRVCPNIGKNISKALKTHYQLNPVSDEIKDKNRQAQLLRYANKPQSEEEKRLRKASCRGTLGKSIIALSGSEIMYRFESAAEACEKLRFKHSQPIYTCCKRRLTKDYPYKSYGLIWMYSSCEIERN